MRTLFRHIVTFISLVCPMLAQDSTIVDHSQEWADISNFTNKTDCTDFMKQAKALDFGSQWLHASNSLDGFIGQNYYRIRFHLSTSQKSVVDPYVYNIQGKDILRDSIFTFEGTIKIIKAFKYLTEYDKYPQLIVVATYDLKEDTTKKNSGIFKGVLRSIFTYHPKSRKLELPVDSDESGMPYKSFTFVGTWEDIKTHQIKQCIWGANRFPFAQGFDDGCCCSMSVSDKYIANGWKTWGERDKKGLLIDDKVKWWE